MGEFKNFVQLIRIAVDYHTMDTGPLRNTSNELADNTAKPKAVARKFPREGPNQEKGNRERKIFAFFLCKRDQNRTKTVKM